MCPLLEEFITFKRSLGLQEKTVSEYVDSISKFFEFYCGYTGKSHLVKQSYKNITTLDMQTYSFKLRETKSVATTRKYLSGVSEFFRFLKAQGYIDVNPLSGVQMQKDVEKKEKVIMTYEQGVQIIEKAENNRNKLILSIMGYLGFRISEVCEIEVKNVDLESKSILFLRKNNKWQTLPIRKQLLDLFTEQVEFAKSNNHKYLFQSPLREQPMNANTVRQQMFNRHRDELGLSKKITPHHFRYAFSTYLVQEKDMSIGEVQIFLGHESENTTRRYVHLNNQKTLDKFMRMDD